MTSPRSPHPGPQATPKDPDPARTERRPGEIRRRPRWWRVGAAVFLLAALAFVVVLLWGQWETFRQLRAELDGAAWRVAPGWLALSLLLGVADLFWMGAAWTYLYRSGGGDLSYARGARVWLATNLGRYIPGKIWQLSGLTLHLRTTGGSGALALTSAVIFQVLVLLSGLAVGAGLLGGHLALLPAGSPLTLILVAILLAGLLHPSAVRWIVRRTARLLREETPRDIEAPRGRDLAVVGGALVVAWAVYGVAFWCLLRGVLETPVAGPWLLTGIFAAAYVAGYLVLVAPGGLVVREGALTALLAALTPLSAAVAGALAVLARVWTAASELLAMAAALIRKVTVAGEGEEP